MSNENRAPCLLKASNRLPSMSALLLGLAVAWLIVAIFEALVGEGGPAGQVAQVMLGFHRAVAEAVTVPVVAVGVGLGILRAWLARGAARTDECLALLSGVLVLMSLWSLSDWMRESPFSATQMTTLILISGQVMARPFPRPLHVPADR